jgi:RNA polymerase sigma-70 factor (ECF subfamily)
MFQGGVPVLDDNGITRNCLDGDRLALNELFSRYEGRIYGLCYQMVRHREDALDLTQEVFLRTLRALHSFNPGRPFFPWLKRIAVNTCLNHLRRNENFFLNPEKVLAARETEACSVEKTVEDAELRDTIHRCLDSLPPVFRVVLALRHYENLSYKEVAEVTGLPLGTVKTYLYRTRAILKKELAGAAGREV